MPESFDTARSGTPDSSTGVQVAGDNVSSAFVQAVYLVYGAAGGPYERVDTATPLPVDDYGGPTASTTTVVEASQVSQTLLAANTSRRGCTVYNNGTSDLYLKLGANASSTDFTLIVAPGGYYEVPFKWRGVVSGVWPSALAGTGTGTYADGEALVTELT